MCYTKGKEMFLADTLSRAFINDKKSAATVSTISTLDPAVMLNCRADTRQRIKAATKDDPELQALSHQIMKGWPAHKSQVTEKLRPFWDSRDLLVSHEDLIYRGNQLVVPRSQRRKMLEIAHQGHVGMEASLRRMREVLYWPGMSKDIRTLVSTCDACLTHSDSPPRQELVQHEVTARPWSKIGVDICQLNDRQLLVVVDYFSNFIEVCRLNTITASVVIKELSALFARFGAPDTVVSDNGRQFDCADFRKFATEWNFEHVTSSPHYAQSNGKAENAVKTVKRLFKKSGETGDSEFIALLNWRNTPSEGMSTSPAERLMGRRCKTLLPCSERMLKPKFDIDKDALDLNVKKEKQASYYNRNVRQRRDIRIGEAVRMKNWPVSGEWAPGKVVGKLSPRSYEVQVGDSVYRRNASMLRPSNEHLPDQQLSNLEPDIELATSDMRHSEKTITCSESVSPAADDFTADQPDPAVIRRSQRVVTKPMRYGYDC